MKQYKWICPECGIVYNAGEREEQTCLECGAGLVYSGYTSEKFDKKTPDKRREIIDAVMNGKVGGSSADMWKGCFWISFLDAIINILIVIGILGVVFGGIILGAYAGLGFGILLVVVGIIFVLLSATMIKIFLGIAEDIRDIRNFFAEKR